jgi:integrase
VSGLHRRNCQTDVRRKRRDLSTEEFSELLKAAKTSKESIQCFSGRQRAMIYTLSFMTGLRRAEIASLTSASFNLEGTPATVTIEARNSKHRKLDVLPLHPELVTMLRDVNGGEKSWRWAVEKCGALEWRIGC